MKKSIFFEIFNKIPVAFAIGIFVATMLSVYRNYVMKKFSHPQSIHPF